MEKCVKSRLDLGLFDYAINIQKTRKKMKEREKLVPSYQLA